MKNLIIFLISLLLTSSVFANMSTVETVVDAISDDYAIEEIVLQEFDGPLLEVTDVVYKIKVSRYYSIGFTSTHSNSFKLFLISDTKSVGKVTKQKLEDFESTFWDYYRNDLPRKYYSSRGGGPRTGVMFTLAAKESIQVRHLTRMIDRLAEVL